MSTQTEMEKLHQKQTLKQIEGKAKHIEINDKSLVAYREEFRKKGLEITKESEYPKEDFIWLQNRRSLTHL
jgi:hypothetical protein